LPDIQGVIFDLGGTLVDWPDWDTAAEERWGQAHAFWRERCRPAEIPALPRFVRAMRDAELAHWRRVEAEFWSGPASLLIREGFARLGWTAGEGDVAGVLDGYARAVDGWARVYPDSRTT
jgi:putative hydrolase of the HAD superfamily